MSDLPDQPKQPAEQMLDLSTVDDPKFKFKCRNGNVIVTDPFEVMEKLADEVPKGSTVFATIREAVGAKEEDLTRHDCLYVLQKIHDFCGTLETAKKIFGLTAKLPDSTTPSPING